MLNMIQDIKEVVHKMDLINRPYVLFLNPDDAETVKVLSPEIEKEFVLQVNPCLENGKCIVMKREDLEKIYCE